MALLMAWNGQSIKYVNCVECQDELLKLSIFYLNQIVEYPRIESFGQSITGVCSLLFAQGHIDGLRLSSPL